MLRDKSLIPLSQQHHNGLALCVLTERSLGQDPSPENVAKLARRAVDRYELELTNHFELEETALFPAVLDELGDLPLIDELLREHRQLEGLVERLRTGATQELLAEFTSLLRRHIRKEENELFEQIQRRLSRPLLDSVGRQLDERAVRICL